jgi:hypothetical protein
MSLFFRPRGKSWIYFIRAIFAVFLFLVFDFFGREYATRFVRLTLCGRSAECWKGWVSPFLLRPIYFFWPSSSFHSTATRSRRANIPPRSPATFEREMVDHVTRTMSPGNWCGVQGVLRSALVFFLFGSTPYRVQEMKKKNVYVVDLTRNLIYTPIYTWEDRRVHLCNNQILKLIFF